MLADGVRMVPWGASDSSRAGTFDSGLEAFDLCALFIANGGLDQGFFGLTSTVPI